MLSTCHDRRWTGDCTLGDPSELADRAACQMAVTDLDPAVLAECRGFITVFAE